jgi:energy-coupling factor transport system permease protein
VSPAARGLAHRAHPFTPFVVAGAVAALAFVLPGPAGPLWLYLAVVVLVAGAGVGGAVRAGLLLCLPLWGFLVVLHGVLGAPPRAHVGPLALSEPGLAEAAGQIGRLGAIVTAGFGLFRAFAPSRFLDAVAVRGWSFPAAYLVVATLQALPRLRGRAAEVLAAQRTRGLRVGGSPAARIRALAPLVLPLVLGALSEVDDRAMALETRAVHGARRRTPLDPPPDTVADRAVRWGAAALVVGAVAWRLR